MTEWSPPAPVTLRSQELEVEILPQFGGKISSMRLLPGGEELLQQPLRPFAERTRTMAFDQGEASGIDECIPTVSACEIELREGKVALPDHGDFWRVPFRHRREGEELVLEAQGFSLALLFEKRLQLTENRLRMSYRLQNNGAEAAPYLWSAHPGFAVEAGDRIHLPDSIAEVAVWYSRGDRLGKPGRAHSWPHTWGVNGEPLDLSRTGGSKDGVGDKLFAAAPREGWVGLERSRLGRRIEIRFDPRACPFVGIWLAYGGWPETGERRQHCVALEPCTAPADSLAVALERGWARTLASGACAEWSIEIHALSA